MRQETKTIYYITCEVCKKEFSFDEKPWENDFRCDKCIKNWKQPQKSDYEDFTKFVRDLEDWEYKTKKTTSYKLWGEEFKKDAFAFFEVDYKKHKDKLEKAWSIVYDDSDGESRSYLLSKLSDLIELIK